MFDAEQPKSISYTHVADADITSPKYTQICE